MPFISVDIEASGPIPGVYDMLSFGAVRVRHEDGLYIPSNDEIYLELRPEYGGVDAGAMRVNKMDLEQLKLEGLGQIEAASRIRAWALEGASRTDPPVFVGYCANFDWAFVNDLFIRTGVDNPFGYKALDIRALAMGILGVPWLNLNQETILPALGLLPLSEALAHNALADARHQAYMLCKLLSKAGMSEAVRR
ncbi:MAG: 3'-5' exonuclease [Myxococcota bacterium]